MKTCFFIMVLLIPTSHCLMGQALAQFSKHPTSIPVEAFASAGPHGGSLNQMGQVQIETVLHHSGINVYLYGTDGLTVSASKVRGLVYMRVDSDPKRYRYDLLPSEPNRLTVQTNLSHTSGRLVALEVHLVGLPNGPQTLRFRETISIPPSRRQLDAGAIARQSVCPVSGLPLGSMGDPLPVAIGGKTVFVCCTKCVETVQRDPGKYIAGKPTILVSTATEADSAMIAKQVVCPVMDERLGGMGQPIKVMVGDRPIFLCCKGCIKKIKAEPAKYLAMVYGSAEPKRQGGKMPLIR